MSKTFDEALNKFFVLLRERDEKHIQENFETLSPGEWDVSFGKKYVRIIHDGSAYAFVEISTGNIYKAASWRSPTTKHIRGNIYNNDPLVGTSIYGVDYIK